MVPACCCDIYPRTRFLADKKTPMASGLRRWRLESANVNQDSRIPFERTGLEDEAVSITVSASERILSGINSGL